MVVSLRRFVCLALILGTQTAYAQSFFDVTTAHENFDAIEYMEEHRIVHGYPDGSYKPFQGINRAEFTKIIIGAMFAAEEIDSCPQRSPGRLFSDVAGDEWFAKYVCLAREKQIVSGYPDGTFHPERLVNFAEANRILAGSFALNTVGYDASNPDPIWYKTYVDALAKQNAIPTSITRFDQSILRGEVAEMVYRLKEKITDKPSKTYEDIANLPPKQITGCAPITLPVASRDFGTTTRTLASVGDKNYTYQHWSTYFSPDGNSVSYGIYPGSALQNSVLYLNNTSQMLSASENQTVFTKKGQAITLRAPDGYRFRWTVPMLAVRTNDTGAAYFIQSVDGQKQVFVDEAGVSHDTAINTPNVQAISPDLRRFAYTARGPEGEQRNQLYVDGVPSGDSLKAMIRQVVFSDDSTHVATWNTLPSGLENVMIDGRDGRSYARVFGGIRFASNNNIAFGAQTVDGQLVLVMGDEEVPVGGDYEEVRHPTSSPDCARMAYVGVKRGGLGYDVVLDGKIIASDTNPKTTPLFFSSDGKHVIHFGHTTHLKSNIGTDHEFPNALYIDGVLDRQFEFLWSPVLSADGTSIGYGAYANKEFQWVVKALP